MEFIIYAEEARKKSNQIKVERMEKFTQMMHSTMNIKDFNWAVEQAIEKGHNYVELHIPQEGYEEEAKRYFTQFGYTTNSSSTPGNIYISW